MVPTPPTAARKPQAKSIIAFSALIMVIFCVVVAYQASRAYQTAIHQGEIESERVVQSLTNHIELTFLAVDLTLRRATERHYFNELFGQNLSQDMENHFRLWVKDTPQVAGLFLADASGTVTLAAAVDELKDIFPVSTPVTDLPLFTQATQSDDKQEEFISLFHTDMESIPNLIVISRSFYRLNSEFGGVMFALVDPAYFTQFFRSIETGPKSFMTMLQPNGQVLVSGKTDEAEEIALTETILKNSTLASQNLATGQTVYQGALKIYSAQRLHIFPLIVASVTDEADFLAAWRSDRRKDVGFLAMFAIFGSILSYFALTMLRQIKRVEESESSAVLASQAKSEFLANMSHELRTPLNAIIGFSEMMDAGYFGKLTPKQKERVHDINLCGNHLLQLINDILEFSKGEAGKMELNEEVMDLGQAVNECLRIIGPRAKNKGLILESKIASQLPRFYGDKRKLRQLLLNLLSNAVKFTEEGGSVTVTVRQNEGKFLELTVADTGIGMNEADIPTAMSVFGQVHRASHPDGTGLGLPLCRMFAELHGGTLDLRSKAGSGTTVTALFPSSRLREIKADEKMGVA